MSAAYRQLTRLAITAANRFTIRTLSTYKTQPRRPYRRGCQRTRRRDRLPPGPRCENRLPPAAGGPIYGAEPHLAASRPRGEAQRPARCGSRNRREYGTRRGGADAACGRPTTAGKLEMAAGPGAACRVTSPTRSNVLHQPAAAARRRQRNDGSPAALSLQPAIQHTRKHAAPAYSTGRQKLWSD